jgi:hypothetical protein
MLTMIKESKHVGRLQVKVTGTIDYRDKLIENGYHLYKHC